MNRQNNTLLVACGLAMGFLAAPALSQVAPPPTKPAEKRPDYTPPPQPEPVASPQPTQPRPQEAVNARTRTGANNLPIHVPYPKLANKGPDGRILRLRQLPDIAALRSNPNVGPKSVEHIMPIVYGRRNQMEISVIDNLDLYWELTSGMIENLDMSDVAEMGRAADMIKPLVPETTLSQELLSRNILSRVQGGMNQYIVQEYKKAITDEIQVLDGDDALEEVMRFVLEDSLHEAELAYQGLLLELGEQVTAIVDEAGVETSEAQALTAYERDLSNDPKEQYDFIQEFDEAFRELPYEDAIKILIAVRQSREFEVLSPTISTIDVLHERKKVMESDGFNVQVRDNTGAVRKDTKEDRRREQEQQQKDDSDN